MVFQIMIRDNKFVGHPMKINYAIINFEHN